MLNWRSWGKFLIFVFSTPQSKEDLERRDRVTVLGLWLAGLFPLICSILYGFIDLGKFWPLSLIALVIIPFICLGQVAIHGGRGDVARVFLMLGSHISVSLTIFLFLGNQTGLNTFLLVFSIMPVVFWHFSRWIYFVFFFALNMGTYAATIVFDKPLWPIYFSHEVAQSFNLFSSTASWLLILLLLLIIQYASTRNELRLAQANEEKSRFFRLLAHDLRGPLGSLMHTLRYLNRSTDHLDKQQNQDFLAQLETGSQNLYTLMDNLLTWAESTQGAIPFRPRLFEIDDLFHELEDFYFAPARKKLVSLIIPHHTDIKAWGDPDQIMVILRNLLGNALKFTPRGGTVILTVSTTPRGVLLSVEDSGIGLTKDLELALFSLGTAVKRPGTEGEPGTGLGLLICKEFAAQHKTFIEAKNKPEGGARFSLLLPLSKDSPW